MEEIEPQTWTTKRSGSDTFSSIAVKLSCRRRTRLPPGISAVPADQRRKADDKRQDPDSNDEQFGARRRHEAGVADRATDGDVAIDADRHQVVDGRCAHPDVDGQPDATPRLAERPVMQHL